jgi:hypothetical protein
MMNKHDSPQAENLLRLARILMSLAREEQDNAERHAEFAAAVLALIEKLPDDERPVADEPESNVAMLDELLDRDGRWEPPDTFPAEWLG